MLGACEYAPWRMGQEQRSGETRPELNPLRSCRAPRCGFATKCHITYNAGVNASISQTEHPTLRGSLLVVAKQPAAGHTKTRLCPPLSGEMAAALYECFLLDTLDIMRRVHDVQCTIVHLHRDSEGYFRRLAPDMALSQQKGDTLGERLVHLLGDALASGSGPAVVMNSDSPTLPAAYVDEAFERLDDSDVVLGPCLDGGYYLIGMKRLHPRLLLDVQMSTPHVLEDTLVLASELDLSVALLPEWYDVDTIAELDHLRSEIAIFDDDDTGAGGAAHTRRYLTQIRW